MYIYMYVKELHPDAMQLKMPPSSHPTIQVGDLQYASPATVSRCGMVYVDPKNLGFKPFWERWVNALPEADRPEFIRLFDKYVPQCISLILEGFMDGRQGEKLKTIVPVTNLNLVGRTNTLSVSVACVYT